MWNVVSEITNSNIIEKRYQNFHDPSNNYNTITDVVGKANYRHMPYILVKSSQVDNKRHT